METEEDNGGFDTICLEKLNISPDFMVNLSQSKGINTTKTTSCLDVGRAD